MSMNNELWQKILDFDFDGPGDYPFTVRLAKENRWTRYFTQQALLEYRRFMYLAATSGSMVSPSEIVDVVWHQHLIFTQSYTEFCTLLGKQIQHIPSTHHNPDIAKFKAAKEHTARVYNETFGPQPKVIWDDHTMLQSLNMPQSKHSTTSFFIIAIVVTILLLAPAYLLLKPLYSQLKNPRFLFCLMGIAAAAGLTVWLYNTWYLKRMINEAEADSFINHLHPYEVMYLKTGNITAAINGSLGELLYEGLAEMNAGGSFSIPEKREVNEPFMRQGMSVIAQYSGMPHSVLVEELQQKSVFGNVERAMEALNSHVLGSVKFMRLLLVNFIVLALPALLMYVRILTGLSRGKAILFIVIIASFYTFLAVMHFKNLLQKPLSKALTGYYLNDHISKTDQQRDWQWLYLAQGPALLGATLLTVAYPNYNPNSYSNNTDGCGSSCGSGGGDGGGCGGGCGGCGGD